MAAHRAGAPASNAFYQENFYRGVLLRQLFWHKARVRSQRNALVLAVVSSQALFALMPIDLLLGQRAASWSVLAHLLAVFCAGCMFAWLYLTTGRVVLVAAVHALANAPVLVSDARRIVSARALHPHVNSTSFLPLGAATVSSA